MPCLDFDDKILTKERKVGLLTCMCYTVWARVRNDWLPDSDWLLLCFTETLHEGMILFLEKKQDEGKGLLSLCLVR